MGSLTSQIDKKINYNKQYRSTGRKIDDPELLEAIRLTIINNMIEYHPVHILLSSLVFLSSCNCDIILKKVLKEW